MSSVEYINSLLKQAQKNRIPGSLEADKVLDSRLPEARDALNNYNSEQYIAFGNFLADGIKEILNNCGLSRKLLDIDYLKEGCRFVAPVRNSFCCTINEDVKVEENHIKDNVYYPSEFYIVSNTFLEDKDRIRADSDMLSKHFSSILTAFLKLDNKIVLSLLRQASLTTKCDIIFKEVTPRVFKSMMNRMLTYGLKPYAMIIGKNVWKDMSENLWPSEDFKLTNSINDILNGYLGTFLDMKLYVDLHLNPFLQTIRPNECFIVTRPEDLGRLGIRQDVKAHSVCGYNIGKASTGYFMELIKGMVVTDCRSVIRSVKK